MNPCCGAVWSGVYVMEQWYLVDGGICVHPSWWRRAKIAIRRGCHTLKVGLFRWHLVSIKWVCNRHTACTSIEHGVHLVYSARSNQSTKPEYTDQRTTQHYNIRGALISIPFAIAVYQVCCARLWHDISPSAICLLSTTIYVSIPGPSVFYNCPGTSIELKLCTCGATSLL